MAHNKIHMLMLFLSYPSLVPQTPWSCPQLLFTLSLQASSPPRLDSSNLKTKGIFATIPFSHPCPYHSLCK